MNCSSWLLVVQARSHVYIADCGSVPNAPQHYCKGNVTIIPHDVTDLKICLPPSPSDIQYSMCVVFVGSTTIFRKSNIEKLRPILVSKSCIEILAKFLTTHNPHYVYEGITFNYDNLHELYDDHSFDGDVSLSCAVQITHIPPDDTTTSAHTINSGYTNHVDPDILIPLKEVLMEMTGFSDSNTGGICHTSSKAHTLQWCLQNKLFI